MSIKPMLECLQYKPTPHLTSSFHFQGSPNLSLLFMVFVLPTKKAMKSKSKTAFTWQSFNYLKVVSILSIPMFQLFNHSQNVHWHVLCNDPYWYTDSSLYSYMSFWNEGFCHQIVMRPNRVELFLTFSVHYTFTDPGSCYSFAGFST